MEDATRLQKMFNELTGYEKKQIDLKINGIPASPMQIVRAHGVHEEAVYIVSHIHRFLMHGVHEEAVYMRDYVLNEEGDIKALWFNSINSN